VFIEVPSLFAPLEMELFILADPMGFILTAHSRDIMPAARLLVHYMVDARYSPAATSPICKRIGVGLHNYHLPHKQRLSIAARDPTAA